MKESYKEKKRRILRKMASKETDKVLQEMKEKVLKDAKQLIRRGNI